MRAPRLASLALTLLAAGCAASASPAANPPAPPPAPAASAAAPTHPPAVDTLHGVAVADPHRWLEAWDDDVKKWTLEQSQRTAQAVRAMPGSDKLRARVRELRMGTTRPYDVVARGKKLFVERLTPPRQQPDLVVMTGPDDASPRVVVDMTARDASGKTSIDFFEPSADGKYVAVSLSRAGTEEGDVHVFETATGRELPDVVAKVEMPGPGGGLAWAPDGAGFFYAHHGCASDPAPDAASFCTTVWHHVLGKPASEDKQVLGEGFPRIAEVHFVTSADGKYVVAQIQKGDGRDYAFWVTGPKKAGWQPVAPFGAGVVRAALGAGGALYLVTSEGAPRGKILATSADAPSLASAKTVVPEGEGGIGDVVVAGGRLFVSEHHGLPMKLRVLDLAGKHVADAALPDPATVSSLVAMGDEAGAMVQSYASPPAFVRVSARGAVTPTALKSTTNVDLRDLEVLRDTCTSKDGTKVDLHVLSRKGAPRTGAAPTILTGYGGFGIARSPTFNPLSRMHLDAGVHVAIAGIRGGGEHGPGWHADGMLTKKQNVFDDFAACAARLVELKVTDAKHLGILGGSNGGLLVGAALTQHPEMFRAAVALVGIFDAVRTERSTNGHFNVTEYGTVENEADFRALYAYSPYHRVVAGTQYPAVLLTAGENDGRVPAWHARKFAAALQASGTKNPVYLVSRADQGHGVGASLTEVIDDNATAFAFLYDALGVDMTKMAR